MRYLVVGAGGTGGCIAGFLANGGKDATLIARGENLAAIREKGLTVKGDFHGEIHAPACAASEDEYSGGADVIFVCVKSYSLGEIGAFLRRVCSRQTIVIPILNGIGIGHRLAQYVPEAVVMDGCIYITAYKASPGKIVLQSNRIRIVCGMLDGAAPPPELNEVRDDLDACGIAFEVSDNIRRDMLMKFSFLSPMAATGVYFDAGAGDMLSRRELRDFFVACVREIESLARALDIDLGPELAEAHLKLLGTVSPQTTTSLQKDLKKSVGAAEIDDILFEPVRLGKKLGVALPCIQKAAERFGYADALS